MLGQSSPLATFAIAITAAVSKGATAQCRASQLLAAPKRYETRTGMRR
jgi:hypothetical protein